MALPIPVVGFCLFVLPQCATCEILVPQIGTELPSPVLEGRVLTTGPPRKSLPMIFNSILQLLLVCEPSQIQHIQSKTISASKFSCYLSLFLFCKQKTSEFISDYTFYPSNGICTFILQVFSSRWL